MSINRARRVLTKCRTDHCSPRRDDLDQCPATINTTLRRLKLLFATEDLKKRKLLLLGDDDLLSVAIVMTDPSIRLTIVDLDAHLLSRIEHLSQKARIKTLCQDLRRGLPPQLARRFDLVFTDPPYTLAGQLLFLKRAISALRPVQGSSLYLCSSRFYLDDQKVAIIIEAARRGGLQLKSVYERFNKYSAPPDVQDDLRRANIRRSVKFFHSTLFHFVLCADYTFPELVAVSSRDIYNY